jgi:aminoglycoside phosphotransferase (APT) family kinase protein
MSPLNGNTIRAVLQLAGVAGLDTPPTIRQEPGYGDEERYRISTPSTQMLLTRFPPTARDRMRREVAGLRLAGEVGVGPELLMVDETGKALGGPIVVYAAPRGRSPGAGPLSADDVKWWLFLLLTLHHLPPERVEVVSSMSPNAATWWQRAQSSWLACQAAYAAPAYQPLIDSLKRTATVVSVHIQAQREVWRTVTRRPCHGNPVPANMVRDGARMTLVEWDAFGLGDPALEVGRAAVLATLAGSLTKDQYTRFLPDYLAGMRDLGDTTLEARLRLVADIMPMGCCLTVLILLAKEKLPAAERNLQLDAVSRAMLWMQRALGLREDDPANLLAPLRAPTR